MNFSNILHEIAKTDPEVFEKTDQRRNVLKNITRKVALTALPFAIGATFQKAYGKTTDTILNTLNFALSLEHLEYAFYVEAVKAIEDGMFPSVNTSSPAYMALKTIRDHEQAHVKFLKNGITAAGGTPVSAKTYDFTVGGALSTFTDYKTMLAVAQVMEDTGVRAYKGQAGTFLNNDLLTAALNIHSVEARHASHIRQMRATPAGGNAAVKPWITSNKSGVNNPDFDPSYAGEELTTQAGVNIINIGSSGISASAASEAFDEPLTDIQVLAIVAPFIS